jgi:predicted adenylyl cyclase CyaB
MLEIERKILDIDVKAVIEKLTQLGAEKTYEGLLHVRYFDTATGKIREQGDLLRVRQFEGRHVEIVYKTNKRIEDGCKFYDEYTFEGKDFDDAIDFFKHLGYSVTCSYEKKRTIFEVEDAEIVIDEYPKISPFLEIEAKDTKTIDDLVARLELENNESSCETINELLKRKYPDIELNNLTFS